MSVAISEHHAQYQRISQAIGFLLQHQLQQPSLEEMAAAIGVSAHYLQRTFSQWAGVSPKQFLHYLTKEQAKRQLQQSSVLETSLACGLSSSSRLHDLMLTHMKVTPGEYRRRGEGLLIHYGVHSSPFGYCLIAQTARGVCDLAFFDQPEQEAQHLQRLQDEWSAATLVADTEKTLGSFQQIFRGGRGHLALHLKGSPFQLSVWEALLRIPEGAWVSYQQVAAAVEKPKAVRAVASAIARNPIAYLIPCHRVIRASGVINQYRWGPERKQALLAWEACRAPV